MSDKVKVGTSKVTFRVRAFDYPQIELAYRRSGCADVHEDGQQARQHAAGTCHRRTCRTVSTRRSKTHCRCSRTLYRHRSTKKESEMLRALISKQCLIYSLTRLALA